HVRMRLPDDLQRDEPIAWELYRRYNPQQRNLSAEERLTTPVMGKPGLRSFSFGSYQDEVPEPDENSKQIELMTQFVKDGKGRSPAEDLLVKAFEELVVNKHYKYAV